MAPWVLESEKKTFSRSLIGFLRPYQGVADADSWLKKFWGKLAASLKLLEGDIIHTQLLSEDDLSQC